MQIVTAPNTLELRVRSIEINNQNSPVGEQTDLVRRTDVDTNGNATEAIDENENSNLKNETAITSDPNTTALTNDGNNRATEVQRNGNNAAATTAAEKGSHFQTNLGSPNSQATSI